MTARRPRGVRKEGRDGPCMRTAIIHWHLMARFVPALRAPASKSATHRALVLAALASGRSHLRGLLVAEDTEATRHGLGALGVQMERSEDGWSVQGTGGRLEGGALLH